MNEKSIYPKITEEVLQKKEDLDPKSMEAWNNFSEVIFRKGALPVKT